MCIQITWDLFQCKFKVSRFGVEPENLDFYEVPKQSQYCWSINHFLNSKETREVEATRD